eukprot:2586495-Pyramimonas_sp.AAC.1
MRGSRRQRGSNRIPSPLGPRKMRSQVPQLGPRRLVSGSPLAALGAPSAFGCGLLVSMCALGNGQVDGAMLSRPTWGPRYARGILPLREGEAGPSTPLVHPHSLGGCKTAEPTKARGTGGGMTFLSKVERA